MFDNNFKQLRAHVFLINIIGLDEQYENITCPCGEIYELFKHNFDSLFNGQVGEIICKTCKIRIKYKIPEDIILTNFHFIDKKYFYRVEFVKNYVIQEHFLFNGGPIPKWAPKIRIPDKKIIGQCSKQIITKVILEYDREYGKELLKYYEKV